MLERLFRRRRAAPLPAVLYTRVDCHLCDVMKAEIARARLAAPLDLVEVDIDTDPALVERHGRSIPVLELDGRPAFKGRLTADALAEKVARRVAARAAEGDG